MPIPEAKVITRADRVTLYISTSAGYTVVQSSLVVSERQGTILKQAYEKAASNINLALDTLEALR